MNKNTFAIGCAVLLLFLASEVAIPIASMHNSVSLQQAALSSEYRLPENGAISIAFDDGMQDQYDCAFPLMTARGMVGTFYIVSDHIGGAFMTIAELQTLQNIGNEIGSHSKSHPSFYDLSDEQIRDECSLSKQVLQNYGLTVNDFAYPYGLTNDHIDSIVSQYYRSGRSAYAPPYIMQLPTSQFNLTGFPGETGNGDALPNLKCMVDQVCASKGWAIIFFHQVLPNPSGHYEISTQDFGEFLDYVTAKGVATLTVNQALDTGRSVHLLLTVEPNQVSYMAGHPLTSRVNVFNEFGFPLEATLTLTVTGPDGYYYFDFQTISVSACTCYVPAEAVGECSFTWDVPNVAGTYVVEASLVPMMLTAYDAVWLKVT